MAPHRACPGAVRWLPAVRGLRSNTPTVIDVVINRDNGNDLLWRLPPGGLRSASGCVLVIDD